MTGSVPELAGLGVLTWVPRLLMEGPFPSPNRLLTTGGAQHTFYAVPPALRHEQREPAVPEDLAWIADAWRGTHLNAGDLYITCARGLSPQQLAERISDHEPVEIGAALTGREASAWSTLHRSTASAVSAKAATGRSSWSPEAAKGGLSIQQSPGTVPRSWSSTRGRTTRRPSSATSPMVNCSCTSSWAPATTPAAPKPTCCAQPWKPSGPSRRKTPSTTCSATTRNYRLTKPSAGLSGPLGSISGWPCRGRCSRAGNFLPSSPAPRPPHPGKSLSSPSTTTTADAPATRRLTGAATRYGGNRAAAPLLQPEAIAAAGGHHRTSSESRCL